MSYPDTAGSNLSSQEQFTALLPSLLENTAPQMGYRLELTNIPLADMGAGYHQAFEARTGCLLDDSAQLVYTFDIRTDKLELTALKLNLKHAVKDASGKILSDCVYIQRWEDGFVQTFGLGDETIADAPLGAREIDTDDMKSLLEPVGLYDLPKDDWFNYHVAKRLTKSDDWSVREQKVIPLPPDDDGTCNQMILIRKRGASSDTSTPRAVYHDNYEVALQRVTVPANTGDTVGVETVDEEMLIASENDSSGRSQWLAEQHYGRYNYPYQPGIFDISDAKTAVRQPEAPDFDYFLQVLGQFALQR
jgi:hypothetical protein